VYPHLLRHTYADLVLSHGSLNAAQQAERLGIRNFDSIISHLGWGRPKGDAGETADQATEGKR
jgi:hypothetical protein